MANEKDGMKKMTDPVKIEQALGIKPNERLATPEQQQAITKKKVIVKTPQKSMTETQQVEKKPETQEEKSEVQKSELTPEDKWRMFQSKFSEQEERAKKLEQQNQLLQQQLSFVTNIVGNFQQNQQIASKKTEKELVVPKIEDFVEDYDPKEGVNTNDPGFIRYQQAKAQFDRETLRKDIKSDLSIELKREAQLSKLEQDGIALMKKYPEYGTFDQNGNSVVNWLKIKQDFGHLAEHGDFLKTKEYLDYKAGKINELNTTSQDDDKILKKLEESHLSENVNDQKISSVASASQVSEGKVDLSDDGEQFKRMFGKV